MSSQSELARMLIQLRNRTPGFGEFIVDGEVSMWKWSTGDLVLSAYLPNEPPGSNQVNVIKINSEDRVVGVSIGLIDWALERVRRHMILEELARV